AATTDVDSAEERDVTVHAAHRGISPMSPRSASRLTSGHRDPRSEEPTMAFHPYLAFAGNCRDAFTRYREIFGGELMLLAMGDMPDDAGPPPPGVPSDAIMHAALTASDALLMGADDPSGNFDGTVKGICVNCMLPDVTETKRVFDALAEGGQVQMPL